MNDIESPQQYNEKIQREQRYQEKIEFWKSDMEIIDLKIQGLKYQKHLVQEKITNYQLLKGNI